MNKKRLIEFCKKKDIFVPSNAKREVVEAAIVRSAAHRTKTNQPKFCFGLWANENGSCVSCDHEVSCFSASFGVSKASYLKAVESEKKGRLRFKRLNKKGEMKI